MESHKRNEIRNEGRKREWGGREQSFGSIEGRRSGRGMRGR